MELYEHLYHGNEVEFDLCKGRPKFDFSNTFGVKTIKEFKRKVKFKD